MSGKYVRTACVAETPAEDAISSVENVGGVAVSPDRLWMAFSNSITHEITVFSYKAGSVYTIGSGSTQLQAPLKLCFHPQPGHNTLLIADSGNRRVKVC